MEALMEALRGEKSFTRCAAGLPAALEAEAPGLTPQTRFVSGAFPMLSHHMRIDGRDFYWLANNTDAYQQCAIAFPGAEGRISQWNCETGENTTAIPSASGSVSLMFRPLEAYWLVFDPTEPSLLAAKEADAFTLGDAVAELDGPWTLRRDPSAQPVLEFPVQYPAAMDAPAGLVETLTPWATWEGVDAFAGLLDYETSFEMPENAAGNLTLDLGEVCHFAEVWVNGSPVGARLWGPYTYDITQQARPGATNSVKIRVGNLIQNNYDEPTRSGLMGPVVVRSAPAAR
jgi:hypothetical protein